MRHNGLNQLKLLVCTALFVTFSGSSQALIPVTDPGTLGQCIMNNVNLALEAKSVKKVVELAGKMNTTIGDQISTFNKYVKKYSDIKKDVNKTLAVANKVTSVTDKVLGTNLNGVVDGAQNLADKTAGVGDTLVSQGGKVAGFASDVQGGIDMGTAAYEKAKETTAQKDKNPKSDSNGSSAVVGESTADSNGSSAAAGGSTGGTGISANLNGPGTNNGYAVLPNELAEYCEITVGDIDDVSKKSVVVDCLKKLITFRNSKTLEDQRAARDIYVKSFHETAYANIAEAVVMRNYAVNYEQEVLDPLSEKLKKAKTVRDDYSGIVTVNKEIANMLNKILMVYASKVSYDALRDYGDFEIYPDDLLELD